MASETKLETSNDIRYLNQAILSQTILTKSNDFVNGTKNNSFKKKYFSIRRTPVIILWRKSRFFKLRKVV